MIEEIVISFTKVIYLNSGKLIAAVVAGLATCIGFVALVSNRTEAELPRPLEISWETTHVRNPDVEDGYVSFPREFNRLDLNGGDDRNAVGNAIAFSEMHKDLDQAFQVPVKFEQFFEAYPRSIDSFSFKLRLSQLPWNSSIYPTVSRFLDSRAKMFDELIELSRFDRLSIELNESRPVTEQYLGFQEYQHGGKVIKEAALSLPIDTAIRLLLVRALRDLKTVDQLKQRLPEFTAASRLCRLMSQLPDSTRKAYDDFRECVLELSAYRDDFAAVFQSRVDLIRNQRDRALRIKYLDTFTRHKTLAQIQAFHAGGPVDSPLSNYLSTWKKFPDAREEFRNRADLSGLMRMSNRDFDRAVEIARTRTTERSRELKEWLPSGDPQRLLMSLNQAVFRPARKSSLEIQIQCDRAFHFRRRIRMASYSYFSAAELELHLYGWKAQHGTFPDSLEQLLEVPAVTEDIVLDRDGVRLGYRVKKDGSDFVVYSIGANLIDENREGAYRPAFNLNGDDEPWFEARKENLILKAERESTEIID